MGFKFSANSTIGHERRVSQEGPLGCPDAPLATVFGFFRNIFRNSGKGTVYLETRGKQPYDCDVHPGDPLEPLR